MNSCKARPLVVLSCTLGVLLAACAPTPGNLSVTADTHTLAPGSTLQLVATGSYSDGTMVDLTALVMWTSSAANIASFSTTAGQEGLITARMAGDVTLQANYLDQSASFALKVTSGGGTLTSLALSPQAATVARGLTLQVSAIATYSDMTTGDVTKMASWSSSDQAVATVVGGLVTAVAAGTATISASLSGLGAGTAIMVSNSTPSAILVMPQNAMITSRGRQSYQATLMLADGTSQDITQQAMWSSSQPAVATISSLGSGRIVATGVASGTTMISASYGGKTGTATLTVQ